MGLTDEEKAVLKRLTEKAKTPDSPPPAVNFSLDLNSDKAWERAMKLGLINAPDDEPEEEPEEDEAPKRSGYFGG